METNKFLRIKTTRGYDLISADVANGFWTNFSFDSLRFAYSWNQIYGFSYAPSFFAEGTNTAIVADKLVDSNADFIAAGVQVGDYIQKAPGQDVVVTAVDSATQLSLNNNVFNVATGIGYGLYSQGNFDLETNLKNAKKTALSTKWDNVVIDVEIPEGFIII